LLINHTNKEGTISSNERLVCISASIVIVAPSIISLFNNLIRSIIILPFKLDTLFIYGIFSIIILLSLKKILNRVTFSIYLVIAIILFGYLISFMLNSYYSELFVNLGVDFLLKSAPWLIVAYAVRDYYQFKKYLYISALIIFVSFMMNLYVFGIDMLGGDTYTQEYTYMLLTTAIILVDAIYDNKRILLNTLLLLISILFMFSMGARGPLVCLVLYVLLKNISFYYQRPKKAIFNSILLTVIGIPIYFFFNNILAKLLPLFQNMNFSTRTIQRILEGSFFEDNSRNSLIEYSIDLLKEYPFMGVGVGNDRILLAEKIGSNNIFAEAAGWYPHNIFLEILLHFGLFLGGIFIFFIIKAIYVSVFKNKNKEAADIICIFIGIGLFPLFFSRSYITSPDFFALMGFCIYQYKILRIYKKEL
jgi:O-antigen ligase